MSVFSNTNIFYNECSCLSALTPKKSLYITDSNTTPLLKSTNGYSKDIPHIEIPSGESSKNLKTIEKILNIAVQNNIGRDGTFIGIGGGVVLDITGFASSIYMRGISSIYVPTTLLAMVDASIGGKTGVDFASFKNLIGSFYAPSAVYISTTYLKSLDDAQYFSGFAELLKIALINRPLLYRQIKKDISQIKQKSLSCMENMIHDAIDGKLEIVHKDFYEKNIRAYLNLGHTFAHALESSLNFKDITHGEAVAWGIGRALTLGLLLKKTKKSYAEEFLKLLKELGYSTDPVPWHLLEPLKKQVLANFPDIQNVHEKIATLLVEKMKKDKKNKNGEIRLVLQRDLGETFIEETDAIEIKKVLI